MKVSISFENSNRTTIELSTIGEGKETTICIELKDRMIVLNPDEAIDFAKYIQRFALDIKVNNDSYLNSSGQFFQAV